MVIIELSNRAYRKLQTSQCPSFLGLKDVSKCSATTNMCRKCWDRAINTLYEDITQKQIKYIVRHNAKKGGQ